MHKIPTERRATDATSTRLAVLDMEYVRPRSKAITNNEIAIQARNEQLCDDLLSNVPKLKIAPYR